MFFEVIAVFLVPDSVLVSRKAKMVKIYIKQSFIGVCTLYCISSYGDI